MIKPLFFLMLLIAPTTAFAYIGPGMAGGVVFTVLTLIGAILLAFLGVLYYPIKRWFAQKKEKKGSKSQKQDK